MTLYTIGHSNLSLSRFFEMLQHHHVSLLVDVRSSPYSRYVPHFNKEQLEREVQRRGMAYRYLGAELGGRPTREDYMSDGHPDYEKMAEDSRLLATLAELISMSSTAHIALMCSEGDPRECHRARLLGRVLVQRFSVNAAHITPKGVVAQLELFPEQGALF